MRKFLKAGLFLIVSGCAAAQAADVDTVIADQPNSVALIAQDMRLDHEARLHGVPRHFDWYQGPRPGMGLDPGAFTAMTAWGQVYEAAQGSPAVNTRVQLRNIAAYYLSASDGAWHLLHGSLSVDGEAYSEDFEDNVNTTADVRAEASGGVSVAVGDGLNYHFWPEGDRAVLPPGEDIAGVFATVQARLVQGDPAGPDDRASARLLVGMGADYWRDVDAQWAEDYANNNDIAIGRHRYVKTGWQSYNMTTLSLEGLRNSPPPLQE